MRTCWSCVQRLLVSKIQARWKRPTIAGSRTRARVDHPATKTRKEKARAEAKERTVCDGVDSNTYRRNDYLYKSDLDRPHTLNADEEYVTGYVSPVIRYRKPPHQSEDSYAVRILVDNCADEHVGSPQDFEWIEIKPSRNPNLVSASGHKLKHYGQQAVPMKLRDAVPRSTQMFTPSH